MVVEIRKVVSAPKIKSAIEQITKETGMSATEYAYGLVVADVNKRIAAKELASDIINENLNIKTLLGEIIRVVDKYEKELSAKQRHRF